MALFIKKNNQLVNVGETNKVVEDTLSKRISNLGSYSVSDSNVTSIKGYAFYNDKQLSTATFSEVTYIDEYSFASSGITSISLPKATEIKKSGLYGCTSLTSVYAPELTIVRLYGFQGCSNLTSISLPKATTLGDYAFTSCSKLSTISVPEVDFISGSVFSYCPLLVSVSFPKVTTISKSAFANCTSLQSITLGANQVCSLSNTNAIPATSSQHVNIYVPIDLVGSYRTATNWSALYNDGYISILPIDGQLITTNVTNGSWSGDYAIANNGTATVTISENNGYELPATITVTGATYTYSSSTGVVELSNPTGPVTITAVCTQAGVYTVSISSYNEGTGCDTYYSLDNGSTWTEITATGTLSANATQIKFKCVSIGNTPETCTINSTTLGLSFSQSLMSSGTYETSNYTLTSDVTDIVIDEMVMVMPDMID